MNRTDSAAGASTKVDNHEAGASVELLEQSNTELKEQNRRFRELKEARSALLAHLTHELRTPLTSILGFCEILLSQEKLTDTQRNFCERIQNSAHQLQRSLNQLADVSRMDIAAGQEEPAIDAPDS